MAVTSIIRWAHPKKVKSLAQYGLYKILSGVMGGHGSHELSKYGAQTTKTAYCLSLSRKRSLEIEICNLVDVCAWEGHGTVVLSHH